MTDTPNISSDWHVIDAITGIEARQISFDTFQIKSSSHILTLNREGFNLYREGPTDAFEKWLDENHIVAEMLDNG